MSVSRRALRRVLLAPSIQEEREPEGEDYEEGDGDGVHEAPDEVVAGPHHTKVTAAPMRKDPIIIMVHMRVLYYVIICAAKVVF